MRDIVQAGDDGAGPARTFRLQDRDAPQPEGRVHMTGVQALVRGVADVLRADAAAGRRTEALVSGYQGSPLGGLDREAARADRACPDVELHPRPAVNEELGATAVWGTQLVPRQRSARVDGVLGVWYGKAPGLDRAADAIRHGTWIGTHPAGGVVALVGDDPAAKSSTLPSASEATLAALHVPVLAPGNVQEAADLVRHAAALSRCSGLWAAVKVVTAVADGHADLRVGASRVVPPEVRRTWRGLPFRHAPDATILAPRNLEMEASLHEVRLPLAVDYVRAAGLNVVHGAVDGDGHGSSTDAWLGLVAPGRTFHELRQALADLGLDDAALRAAGVRLLQVRAPWPVDEDGLRAFAAGLEEIVVVEEKDPFLERHLKEALYGTTDAPRVLGARDERGTPLVPVRGELTADAIARAVGPRLARRLTGEHLAARLAALERPVAPRASVAVATAGGGVLALRTHAPGTAAAPPAPATRTSSAPAGGTSGGEVPATPERTPFFCSGCPHSTSLRTPDDALVGAGIGCHTMALLAPEGKGTITGATQMGGEGAQWVGMEPFLEETEAFVQNVGDGTFAHSAGLAVRFAVAAGAHVTYRLLYNDAVAMTGGQDAVGGLDVPALCGLLRAEGVARVILTTERPEVYRGVRLPGDVEVRPRERIEETLAELRGTPGVTVLIHDQVCAAEKRRRRRKGLVPSARERIVINERVCEGCGDCGRKSTCLSVQPVPSEFGRKTRIHLSSCNDDATCLQGDCPSFTTVTRAEDRRGPAGVLARRRARRAAAAPAGDAAVAPLAPPADLPPAPAPPPGERTVRLVGVGGTGVVNVSQVLGVAAVVEGRHAAGTDLTGLSQKGGTVVSDVRFADAPVDGSPRPSRGALDGLLAFDLLGASTDAMLAAADPALTAAVLSTHATPTGHEVSDPTAPRPDVDALLRTVSGRTRPDRVVLDAVAASEALLGDHLPANLLLVGAAVQAGVLPLRPESVERAVELGGLDVEANVAAFRWGRAAVAAPEALAAALARREREAAGPPPDAPSAEVAALVDRAAPHHGALRDAVAVRVPELVAFQSLALAADYAGAVAEVRAIEAERVPGEESLALALARGLHHLMAYKDEYEIARLHLDPAARAAREVEFGPGALVRYHLEPPVLKALGRDGKLPLGPWIRPAFGLLHRMRRLRGTPLDPFGRTRVRRAERALPGEYRAALRRALRLLNAGTHERVRALAALPEEVRGYESIKLEAVATFRSRLAVGLAELEAADAPAPVAARGPVPTAAG